MCIANRDMSDEEKNELLASGKPNAEEDFINKKLNNRFKENYRVIFVPTTLFELFAMTQYKKKDENNPLYAAFSEGLGKTWGGSFLDKEVKKVLQNTTIRPSQVHPLIYNAYQEVNKTFYKDAYWSINNQLAKKLFENIPTLKTEINPLNIANAIKQKAPHLIASLAKENESRTEDPNYPKEDFVFPSIFGVSSALKNIDNQKTITLNSNRALARFVELEYEARELNKALLVRGSDPFELTFDPGKPAEIIATTIDMSKGQYERGFYSNNDLLRLYHEKKLASASLSFGNSLFAGAIGDATGCVYYYLTQPTSRPQHPRERANKACLALSINKKSILRA